jgi:hypothetical protein
MYESYSIYTVGKPVLCFLLMLLVKYFPVLSPLATIVHYVESIENALKEITDGGHEM